MVLQQPMPAAELAIAEPAVPDNALGRISAVFEIAADLFGRHASAEGERHVDY